MYRTIAIAGTFDRLHKGHRYFISEAFKLGRKVVIGLTSDEFVRKSKVKSQKSKVHIKYQKYHKREEELKKFLTENRLLNRAEIVKIDDIYGPAASLTRGALARLETLVVTEETYNGGLLVNKKRKVLGLPPLKLFKLPMILADDKKRIASTRIREGEIDRWGKAFVKQMQIPNSKFQISNELRMKLKKPLGQLIAGDPKDLKIAARKLKTNVRKIHYPLIITVGDEVTKVCNQVGIPMNLAIFDYRVGRIEKYHSLEELGFNLSLRAKRSNLYYKDRHAPPKTGLATTISLVENPPGHITKDLVDRVKNSFFGIIKDGKQRIIQVNGEEDLAGVPAVLLAPLGAVVLYGQPGEGVVLVEVTEEKKKELLKLIGKFAI